MLKKANVNLVKLVSILNDGEYHGGDAIGTALATTRTAVWKIIKKLKKYGLPIESVKGKGYRLAEPCVLLELEKIQQQLTRVIEIELFESIASTNAYLKKEKTHKTSKICLAEFQTQAKGRLDRNWYAPFGKNIYLSLLYPFRKDISELSGLSLVMSLAIVKTLKRYGEFPSLYVKWPNDILHAGKKISGALIEILAESHGFSQAIIGIGININMQNDNQQISQPWTSLKKMTGNYIDRNEFCAHLINQLLSYLQQFEEQGFAGFMEEWMQVDGLLHQEITLKNIQQKISGKVQGINEHGHLLLKLPNGAINAFSSGDATIMKEFD